MKTQKTIGVMGLGYVGVVNLACFSHLGHKVIGCDIKSQKVEAVLKGISPVLEPGVNEMLAAGLANGTITATTDAATVVRESDVIFVCVGTPSMEDGTVNLDFTINTTLEIGRLLQGTAKDLLLVFRSTIPPGTVETVLRPQLMSQLGSFSGRVRLAFYPEFLREGSAVQDFLEAPRIVIGSQEPDMADLQELLSYNEDSPVILTDTRTAEFVKYVDNAWHALKCTFANEAYHLGAKLGVDVPVANEIFFMDRTLNISTNYLKPGLPFGGSCLPKDLRAISRLASQQNVDAPMLLNTLTSNRRFQQRLADQVVAAGKKKVALVGLTFKNHTDDVRESPMLFLAKDLIAAGLDLRIWDEDINLTTLRIEQAGIVKHISDDLAAIVGDAEVIIVCKRYMAQVAPIAKAGQLIFNYADHKDYATAAEVRWLYR